MNGEHSPFERFLTPKTTRLERILAMIKPSKRPSPPSLSHPYPSSCRSPSLFCLRSRPLSFSLRFVSPAPVFFVFPSHVPLSLPAPRSIIYPASSLCLFRVSLRARACASAPIAFYYNKPSFFSDCRRLHPPFDSHVASRS